MKDFMSQKICRRYIKDISYILLGQSFGHQEEQRLGSDASGHVGAAVVANAKRTVRHSFQRIQELAIFPYFSPNSTAAFSTNSRKLTRMKIIQSPRDSKSYLQFSKII